MLATYHGLGRPVFRLVSSVPRCSPGCVVVVVVVVVVISVCFSLGASHNLSHACHLSQRGGLSTTPATGAFSLFFLVVYYPCYCYWIVSLLVPRRFLLPCCRSFVFSHFRWYIYVGGMLSASCRCAGSLPPSFSSMPCRLLSLFICLCAAKVGHA